MKRIIICVFLFLTLLAGCGVSDIGIKYAGVRSSSYGIKPFPEPPAWEKRVKLHNPSYRMFLKHWDRRWMPPRYRGDILFVSDSQQLENREKMLEEFVVYWAEFFKPNPVGFQVGYKSDYTWWGKLKTPAKDIGSALAKRIQQECSIFWVDFTLRKVLPTDNHLVGVKIYDMDIKEP